MGSGKLDKPLTINGDKIDNAFCIIREDSGDYRYITYCEEMFVADILVNSLYKIGEILTKETDNPYLTYLGEAVLSSVHTVIEESKKGELDAEKETGDTDNNGDSE
tara:strand:+ start:3356 stop:3673 length:318 start_codon:yes stop_codon:yes gene_type:complete